LLALFFELFFRTLGTLYLVLLSQRSTSGRRVTPEKLIPQARDALHASTGSDASWERVCTEGAQLPTGQAVEEALAWLHGQKRPIRTAPARRPFGAGTP